MHGWEKNCIEKAPRVIAVHSIAKIAKDDLVFQLGLCNSFCKAAKPHLRSVEVSYMQEWPWIQYRVQCISKAKAEHVAKYVFAHDSCAFSHFANIL